MRRLILFDVDGTLVRGGPARPAFGTALEEVFGTTGRAEGWDFSGKTDPQIVRELMEDAGFEPVEVRRALPRLWRRYLGELEARLSNRPMRVLPGVAEALQALDADGEVALGLVTGNIVRGAVLKLRSVGLRDPFPLGAFGSDHEVRNHLPGIAMDRAARHWGRRFSGREVVVVGDTPRDVACGRHHGTRTVAVATGRFTVEELADAGADEALPDLSDTSRVLEVLTR